MERIIFSFDGISEGQTLADAPGVRTGPAGAVELVGTGPCELHSLTHSLTHPLIRGCPHSAHDPIAPKHFKGGIVGELLKFRRSHAKRSAFSQTF